MIIDIETNVVHYIIKDDSIHNILRYLMDGNNYSRITNINMFCRLYKLVVKVTGYDYLHYRKIIVRRMPVKSYNTFT